jgi:hypothetical protein
MIVNQVVPHDEIIPRIEGPIRVNAWRRVRGIPVSQAQEHCFQNMVFWFADFSGTD